MNTREVEKKLKEVLPDIRKKYHVKQLGIFGSYARGEQSKNSDIDILVQFDQVSYDSYFDLKEYLENVLQLRVDLLVKSNFTKRSFLNLVEKETIYV